MKAITICQPFADLCLLPDEDPDHKRTENRTWYSSHRGPLLIHAGKSHKWLDYDDPSRYVFGAIVGRVEAVACFTSDLILDGELPTKFSWLKEHKHVEGPYCHVYLNPVRFPKPIPWRGALRFFDVPDDVVHCLSNQLKEKRDE